MQERKLASIQVIKDLQPIPGADNIEKATVLGWEVVVKKGEFKVGDKCIYIEIDSVLPEVDCFEFMRKHKFRLKTVRLKGQVSQGLALPFIFTIGTLNEGADVTEHLGITKYEPPVPMPLQGFTKGNFPSFLVKTDEPRLQSNPEILEKLMGEEVYITEKLDGTSMSIYYKDGEIGVCSRNQELKRTYENRYWNLVKESNIEEALKEIGLNICIQGELVGPGIQGNKYELKSNVFYIYSIFNIDKDSFYDFKALHILHSNIVFSLKCSDVFLCPYIGSLRLSQLHDMDYFKELSKRKSELNHKIHAEGIVVRNMHDIGGVNKASFKVINPEFLLKYSE